MIGEALGFDLLSPMMYRARGIRSPTSGTRILRTHVAHAFMEARVVVLQS